jgi:hypothetical protein
VTCWVGVSVRAAVTSSTPVATTDTRMTPSRL